MKRAKGRENTKRLFQEGSEFFIFSHPRTRPGDPSFTDSHYGCRIECGMTFYWRCMHGDR